MTKQDKDTTGSRIWTIGHWTCPIPVFLETLDERSIDMLIDVRAHPGSRRNPQFGTDEMKKWLPENGIAYQLFPKMGGRRRKQDVPPEINAGWNNASFKNYADYTLTEKYHEGIAELKELTQKHRVAIMCGEPMPWRCHRLLISNTLAAQGFQVEHLVAGQKPKKYELGMWGATPHVDGDGQVTYPAEPTESAEPAE